METNISKCEENQVVLLPIVYGAEFIVALTGNLFALWLLMVKERRNWHTGIVLSCNLIISDLLYILTLPLLVIYHSFNKHWVFGDFTCKIERFLFTCNLYVSIFFIMAISVNRCVALICPFFTRSHVEPVHAKVISGVIWIVVGVMSCPVFKFASICQNNNNLTQCVSFCDMNDQRAHFTYKMFLAMFGCLIPFLVTFTSYCVVIRVAWKNVSLTTLDKRKIALLVISVIVLYVFSFLPYHVFQVYHLYLRMHNHFKCWIYNMYQVSKGMASLSMCIHPMLYITLFDSIRVACCGKSQEDNNSVEMKN